MTNKNHLGHQALLIHLPNHMTNPSLMGKYKCQLRALLKLGIHLNFRFEMANLLLKIALCFPPFRNKQVDKATNFKAI